MNQHRVLIVSGDCSLDEQLIDGLEKTGCAITKATNGQQALQTAGQVAPEFVLLDEQLVGTMQKRQQLSHAAATSSPLRQASAIGPASIA